MNSNIINMDAKLLINNNLIDSASSKYRNVTSPWEGQQLGTYQLATPDQARFAVDSAAQAFLSWQNTSVSERVALLRKTVRIARERAAVIATQLCLEIGKTIEEARAEVDRATDYIELTLEAALMQRGNIFYGDIFSKYPKNRKTGYYSRQPLGVILAISPFNYPINLSVTKIAPALATGNTVVFKPAGVGCLAAFLYYQCFLEAGFPPGVLNFVSGDSGEIGDLLISNPKIALIAFTGSSAIGNHIREIALGVPLLLELGGKDAAIVTKNADLELAAQEIVNGAFSYSGQRCTAQKILYVVDSIANQLEDRIVSLAHELPQSPLINNDAADFVETLIADAENKGALTILKGKRSGNKMSPSVLVDITPEMRIYNEEQFGPALPIVEVKDEAEAIRRSNSSRYGLQASIFSRDLNEAFKIAAQLEVGTVQINGRPDRGPDNFPFGGVKDSGQMMQGLQESLDLMTRGKLIVVNLH